MPPLIHSMIQKIGIIFYATGVKKLRMLEKDYIHYWLSVKLCGPDFFE